MNYYLPKSVTVNGQDYAIRSDYRVALDILTMLADPELTGQEKASLTLQVFYPDAEAIPLEDRQEALRQCVWFLDCGEDSTKKAKGPRVMDWEQDFTLIAAPVNRVVGHDVRGMEYLHWWTFASAYNEIGDCLFAQIVSIRSKKASGKKLDKGEQEFYRKNHGMIDLKKKYTEAEDATINTWLGIGSGEKKDGE